MRWNQVCKAINIWLWRNSELISIVRKVDWNWFVLNVFTIKFKASCRQAELDICLDQNHWLEMSFAWSWWNCSKAQRRAQPTRFALFQIEHAHSKRATNLWAKQTSVLARLLLAWGDSWSKSCQRSTVHAPDSSHRWETVQGNADLQRRRRHQGHGTAETRAKKKNGCISLEKFR